MKQATISIDGASKGNPGPAGIGVVISDSSGKVIREISEHIGEATNNVAEYKALIRGLSEALSMGFTRAVITTDSELMARQLSGEYRVKSANLASLVDSARDLMGRFKAISVSHVTRDKNKRADELASAAASKKTEVAQPALLSVESPSAEVESPTRPVLRQEGQMTRKITIRTASRIQFLDITRQVQDAVEASGVRDGLCTVYVPHTTAGVTINENADPDVQRDIIETLERLVPRSAGYRHTEGNADSHVKASLMGFSTTVIIEDGRLLLGTWQGIFFCEFDGPRTRQVYVRIQ